MLIPLNAHERGTVLDRLDWSHEGPELSRAIRKARKDGPFVPPHTARHARNTPERTTP